MYGERLKILRKQASLTQEQLAIGIDEPRSNVSLWEKQAYPPLNFIIKAVAYLKPDQKLWEFFVDDMDEVDKLLPAWVEPEQIEFLKIFNSLKPEIREQLLSGFLSIVKAQS